MSRADASCDVLVIGAGIIGCAVASELARRDRRVLVVDRGEICSGSSGRNAGGVRHQFSNELNIRLATRTITRIERLPEELGADPLFRKAGYLFLASTPESAALLRRSAETQRGLGVPTELLDPDEIAALVPGIRVDDLVVGTFCAEDGYVDPHALTMGLATDALRHGARIRQGTEIVALERRRNRVVRAVVHGGEQIRCECVVNCAGAAAGAVGELYGARVPIAPARSQVYTLADTPVMQATPMTIDFDSAKLYFHPDGPGLVAGMDDAAGPPVPYSDLAMETSFAWERSEELAGRLCHRMPSLEGARVTGGWAGLLELTPDENPVVGWHCLENTYIAAGFSGHGLSIGLGLAEDVARELCDEPPSLPLDAVRPDRFAMGLASSEALAMR